MSNCIQQANLLGLGVIFTSNTSGGAHDDINQGFFGELIPTLRFDGAIYCADDGVASIRKCCRAISAMQVRQERLRFRSRGRSHVSLQRNPMRPGRWVSRCLVFVICG